MEYYYSLSPDIAIVRLAEGGVLFKSDTLGIRLEGQSAVFLADKILPLLDGQTELLAVVAQIPHLALADLQANLDHLVHARVLQCRHERADEIADSAIPRYFRNFLSTVGREEKVILPELSRFRIAVIGLDAHGTQTILSLVQAGINNFLLIDPFPCDKVYLETFPFLSSYGDPGGSKQDCLGSYLTARTPGMAVSFGPDILTKESLQQCLTDLHLCIVCMDKGFSSVYYWTNQVSVAHGIPALYSAIRGHKCFAGPFVMPEKTACYMCYKMRQVATQENFDEGMSYEEYLNNQKRPAFGDRNVFPAAIPFMASVLSSEAIKYALSLDFLSLPDKVLEFNAINFQNKTHTLLQKPDCPVCQKKKTESNIHTAADLIRDHGPSRLIDVLDDLISPHTGILKSLDHMAKDITEPKLPYVFVAHLANHHFLPKEKHEMLRCSGKGMDLKSARVSAAGEAVERYSGTVYPPEKIVFGSFAELGGSALDPKRLVLYMPHQYDNILYKPFSESEPMGWILAYSLVYDKPVYVPAHSAIMNYSMRSEREHIFQSTSNGLAAGGSLLSAVLSAALEVIERDAFIITWHNKLPAMRVSLAGHPDADIRELEIAYNRRGVELRLYRLATDAPAPVFLCISVQVKGDGPMIVTGLGCDLSAAKAARQAVMEVGQIRPSCKNRLQHPANQERLAKLIADPSCVEELEDHDLLYFTADHLHAFDFLFQQPIMSYEWDQQKVPSAAEQLHFLIDYCRQIKSDLIYCDLTPPDMEKLGLFTARVIIPDLQPIHFGWKNIRLGGDRLFELPVRLGFAGSRVSLSEINPFPHPMA